jgi:hypothetical protein
MLFRAFPPLPGAAPTEPGGALHVPRAHQGRGRHDDPDTYGALYLSRDPAASIAEILIAFRTQPLVARHLMAEGFPYRLASIEDSAVDDLVDLDDPGTLVERALRPSGVATRVRRVTQRVARSLYEEGAAGFEWWSAIEASWINVTLFEDRVEGRLSVVGAPERLTLDHPAVREAAEAVGVMLG